MSAVAFSACSLDTEVQSEFDESVVFSNYTLAEYNVFGISHSFGETNNYRGRYLPWYGVNTDIEWYNSAGDDERAQMCQYNITTNNGQLNLENGPYNKLYEAIERANICIRGLRTYGNVENDPQMAYLLGEALTMRAVIYADLMKAWGDVPARFEPITPETIYLPKSSRDVIYKQLLADLEESFDYLFWPAKSAQTMTTDRINLAFAKGLYARLALAASGYALRPEDGMVGTGDAGRVRITNDPDLQKEVLYPKALAALEDVINSGSASLAADYEQYWRKMNNSEHLTAGEETLWVIPFSDSRGRWNFTFAIRDADLSNRGGSVGPVPTLYFDYAQNDVRRDISCVNWRWEKGHVAEPAGPMAWYFGKFRFEWQIAHPYTGGNDDGVKPVYMRYSDILLMAAEIENELNGPDKAKGYLKEVRRRAFKGNESEADAYVDALNSKEDFFNAIVEERKFEFVGEQLRKGDLIRWNMLGDKLEDEEDKLLLLAKREGKYASLMNEKVWYRSTSEGAEIWGLTPETSSIEPNLEEGWEEYGNYIYLKNPDDDKMEKVESIYNDKIDPDTRQFWPIFDVTIINSQGTLKNDYGY